jgi:hypothetical protein
MIRGLAGLAKVAQRAPPLRRRFGGFRAAFFIVRSRVEDDVNPGPTVSRSFGMRVK